MEEGKSRHQQFRKKTLKVITLKNIIFRFCGSETPRLEATALAPTRSKIGHALVFSQFIEVLIQKCDLIFKLMVYVRPKPNIHRDRFKNYKLKKPVQTS